jgi:hypothetical protein
MRNMGAALVMVGALGGCTLTQLDTLVPQSVVSDIGSLPGTIQVCSTSSVVRTALAQKQAARLATIHSKIDTMKNALPTRLATDPVVGAVLEHVRYVSTTAIVNSRKLLNNGQLADMDVAYMAASPRPRPILQTDLLTFIHTVAEVGLRNTSSQPGTGDLNQEFGDHLKAYYSLYYKGSFTNYFSQTIMKPTAQLTIGDTEIAQAAGIFLELLFD